MLLPSLDDGIHDNALLPAKLSCNDKKALWDTGDGPDDNSDTSLVASLAIRSLRESALPDREHICLYGCVAHEVNT